MRRSASCSWSRAALATCCHCSVRRRAHTSQLRAALGCSTPRRVSPRHGEFGRPGAPLGRRTLWDAVVRDLQALRRSRARARRPRAELVAPAAGLAHTLRARGHHVVFGTGARHRDAILGEGYPEEDVHLVPPHFDDDAGAALDGASMDAVHGAAARRAACAAAPRPTSRLAALPERRPALPPPRRPGGDRPLSARRCTPNAALPAAARQRGAHLTRRTRRVRARSRAGQVGPPSSAASCCPVWATRWTRCWRRARAATRW